jgi:cation diffusion facilitator family transporter
MIQTQREKKGNSAVIIGLISNIILAVLKTIIGVIGHSPALLADGINSTSDTAYYIVVSSFMRRARKPADDEHPYGHNQLESIGALVVGAFVITTAIAIFWDSIITVYELLTNQVEIQSASLSALIVAFSTIILKIILTKYTENVGKQTKNTAVMALAYDHRNDIFSASAALIGIFFGRMGYFWLDPLAGAVVAIVILNTGIQILKESTEDLMDTIPGVALREQITNLFENDQDIERIDDIKTHRFGPYLVINITVCVDGDISVKEGDKIATKVEQSIFSNIEFVRNVHVHYHPLD